MYGTLMGMTGLVSSKGRDALDPILKDSTKFLLNCTYNTTKK